MEGGLHFNGCPGVEARVGNPYNCGGAPTTLSRHCSLKDLWTQIARRQIPHSAAKVHCRAPLLYGISGSNPNWVCFPGSVQALSETLTDSTMAWVTGRKDRTIKYATLAANKLRLTLRRRRIASHWGGVPKDNRLLPLTYYHTHLLIKKLLSCNLQFFLTIREIRPNCILHISRLG